MSAWSAATEALWRATLASDVGAARRALFQGADPCAERPGTTLAPALDWEGPFARALMGRAESGTKRWVVDLPLLDLLLDHGAMTLLPGGQTPLAVVVASNAFNADRAVSCLVAHGAVVRHEYASSVLLTMAPLAAAPVPIQERRATQGTPLLDALWHYMDEAERQVLLQNTPKMMTAMLEKYQQHPDPVALAWLATHGADVAALQRSGWLATHAIEKAALQPSMAPPGPATSPAGNVVAFRPRRR